MLKTSDTEARLKTMLLESGFDFEEPDPQLAWEVFKSFAQEPVESAREGILFQCGVFGFGATQKRFYLDFVRQFELEAGNGEYDHMEQLHCEFICEPNSELEKVEKNL